MTWSRVVGIGAVLALACSPREGATPSSAESPRSSTTPGTGTGTGTSRGESEGATAPVGSPGCGKASRAGASAQKVNALGKSRAFTLVVPEGYSPRVPYPLVVVLHGGGGSAAGARAQTDLEKVAGGNALFVYPEAVGGTWNLDAPTASNGDVALFDAVLLFAHNTLCVDGHRVFLTGFSNGAYMANQLACKRGERIRAVVTHAGGGPYETSGTYDATGHLMCPGKAVASLVVHGTSDGTVPPNEGQKSIDHWSYASRCGSGTTSTLVPPCVALQGCLQPVGTCKIPGLGHGLWSQAGKITWSFFDALK